MKIKIVRVRDNGDHATERIVLKALSTTDVGSYILCDSTYTEDDQVSNRLRHTFWFPDQVVNAGDFIVVHTRKGRSNRTANKSGTTTHNFYWGLDVTVWNEDGDAAVLLEIGEWAAYRIAATE